MREQSVEPVEVRNGPVRLTGDRWRAANPVGTAVLLPGGGQTRHSWFRTGAQLHAAGWDVVSMDLRGHGDSAWSPDGGYGLDRFVDDLQAVVDLVGELPVLIGASLGGITSLLGQGERGLGRALVLVDIVPDVEDDGVERIVSFMASGADGFASLEDAAEAVRAYNQHRQRPPTADGLRKNLRKGAEGRWHWHWDPRFLGTGRATDEVRRTRDAARSVSVPTLLVRGEHSDVVSASGVEEFLQLIPHARYVDVRNTGHMVAGDDNDVFGAHLAEFLAGLPGPGHGG